MQKAYVWMCCMWFCYFLTCFMFTVQKLFIIFEYLWHNFDMSYMIIHGGPMVVPWWSSQSFRRVTEILEFLSQGGHMLLRHGQFPQRQGPGPGPGARQSNDSVDFQNISTWIGFWWDFTISRNENRRWLIFDWYLIDICRTLILAFDW